MPRLGSRVRAPLSAPLHVRSRFSNRLFSYRRSGQVVRQRPAKPLPPVRIRASPPERSRGPSGPLFMYGDPTLLATRRALSLANVMSGCSWRLRYPQHPNLVRKTTRAAAKAPTHLLCRIRRSSRPPSRAPRSPLPLADAWRRSGALGERSAASAATNLSKVSLRRSPSETFYKLVAITLPLSALSL